MLSNLTQKYNLIKIRIDDAENDPDKIDFTTTVDNFDDKLYADTIQGKSKFDLFQKESVNKCLFMQPVRYRESVNLYKFMLKDKETIYNYIFKSNSSIDPLFLKGGFKKKLSRIFKNTQYKKSRVKVEHYYNSNDVSSKRRISSTNKVMKIKNKDFIIGDYDSHESNLIPKSKDENKNKSNNNTSINVSKSSITKKVEKQVTETINNINLTKELKLPEDSIISYTSNKTKIKSNFDRPEFVERLFETYNYNDFESLIKIQNHNKNKNLCISVIQDIYNKITY